MPAVYLAVFLSACAFALSVFSFFFFRHYLKRRTGQERILSELREEVNNIVLSLDEKTDRDISLIEEREKALRSLLDEIDKRLKVYIRELGKRREDEAAHAALAAKAPAPTYNELGKSRYRLTEQGPPASEPAPAAAPAPSASTVVEQVRELVRAGFTAPAAASRLGISITEVELAMAFMEMREQ